MCQGKFTERFTKPCELWQRQPWNHHLYQDKMFPLGPRYSPWQFRSDSKPVTVPVDRLLICLWYCHFFWVATGVLSSWAFWYFVCIGSGDRTQGFVLVKHTQLSWAWHPDDAESLALILKFSTRLFDFLSLMSFKYKFTYFVFYVFCEWFLPENAVLGNNPGPCTSHANPPSYLWQPSHVFLSPRGVHVVKETHTHTS